ncbi:MAG: GGDEF domain-containing protein [Brevinematales bacterium]
MIKLLQKIKKYARIEIMKKRIAIFISTLHDEYQRMLVKSFSNAASSYDVDLIFFVGYSLLSPYGYQHVNNFVFSLAKKTNIDGIIVSSTLFTFIKKDEVKEFLDKFQNIGIKTVVFSYKIDGYQCILVNPKKGIIEAIDHLVKKHNAKKIVFIKGPVFSEEANDRYNAYLEGLKKNNIKFDENLVLDGFFNKVDGYQKTKELIEQKKIFPDAIFCANDNMCLGVLEYLKENNIKVPEEIKLIGFDDISETRTTIPSITTIRQPLDKMAETSLSLFFKNQEEKEFVLDSELIIRESCGCNDFYSINYNQNEQITSFKEIENILPTEFKEFLAIIESMNYKTERETIENIKSFINSNINDIPKIKKIFFKIKNFIFSSTEELTTLKNTERVISIAFSYIYEIKERLLIKDLYYFLWNQNSFEYASQFITMSFNMEELIKNLKSTLNSIRIKNFLLCLFKGRTKFYKKFEWQIPSKSRIIICYMNGQLIEELENKIIPTEKLIPENFLIEKSSVVLSLFYENECIGYLIASPLPEDTISLTILRREISMVIKGTALIEKQIKTKEKLRQTLLKLKNSNQKLEELSVLDELTGLYNRRGFYTVATKFIELAKRNHREFFIFFLDLNGLKKINDNYGHKEGDFAIKSASEILLKTFRHTDIIARMGGDEFVVMAIDCTIKDLANIDKRLKENQEEINNRIQKPYKISFSYGVAPYQPGKIYSLDELLEEADRNLYIEKRKFYS